MVIDRARLPHEPAEHHEPMVDQPWVDIPNLTLVKNRIREYYGDYVGDDGRHHSSPTSAWSRDVMAAVARARNYLERRMQDAVDRPALILDVDDTALSSYPYLANNEFGARQNREVLPAIAPVLGLARYAGDHAVALFFITERLTERRDDTLANLLHVGFPAPTELFLRARTPPFPSYLTQPDCGTVEFKSATRAYIESFGYRILLCIGDQHSDLAGGHAEMTVKLPNPMYRIP